MELLSFEQDISIDLTFLSANHIFDRTTMGKVKSAQLPVFRLGQRNSGSSSHQAAATVILQG